MSLQVVMPVQVMKLEKSFYRCGASVVMLNRNAAKSKAAIAVLKSEVGADADVRFMKWIWLIYHPCASG